MSALDIFVIVLLAGGAIIGFVRGLVHEMLSLLAWVVAIVMLRLFHTPVSVSLTDAVGGTTGAAVLTFVLLFLPSFLFMKLLARSIGKKTRSSMLGPFDRVLGGGFGMLKGLLAVTLFFLLANLATDLTYGPERTAARVDAQFADLSLAERQRARGGRLGRNASQGLPIPQSRN